MTESLPLPAPRVTRRAIRSGAASITRARVKRVLAPAAGPAFLVVAAVWLCRRLLFGGQLPAGTDVLDLVARAQQNAHWSAVLSPWSPSGLGLPRQVSLDNLLGLVVLVTGNAPRTIAVLLSVVFLATGITTFWVVKRWYGDRVVATVAGLIYMTSQSSLGRIASGWLHYELLVALAPLLIHLWIGLVRRFEPARALAFAALAGAVVFARPDLVLWLIPAFVVYACIHLLGTRERARSVLEVAKTSIVVVPVIGLLSLYFVVPLAAGIRAPWVTTGQVFEQIRFNLVDRSLDAYQSLLGFGRDLGYLPFNGESWWNYHPWFPLPIYYEIQALVVVAAIAALWFRRDERTVFLVALAIVAAFLGKGIRGPFGAPYWFGVEHVPVFGSLRGPNRWLIEQSFCYATLFAITVRACQRRVARLAPRVAAAAPAVAVCGTLLALLPVAPTLLAGFRTWAPTPGAVELLKRVGADRSTFSVATAPYDQSMGFVSTSSYQGWEHDLGVESPLYTAHSTLSTNSWDRRGSDFVDYTASLLRSGDPAFARLLGSVGVKYLVGFRSAGERMASSPTSRRELRRLARQPNATAVLHTSAGTLYRDSASSPLLSFRTNLAVVLGGRSGIAAFADVPGVRLKDWAVQTADDLLAQPRPLASLVSALDDADTIVVADTSVRDLSVLATTPVVHLPGITSDPGLERRAGLLLNDESARRGSLADQSVPPPALVATTRTSFRVPRARRLELWTRILEGPRAGTVSFSVDGLVVRRLLPLEGSAGRFAWIRVGTFDFASGTHTITVAGGRSDYGSAFEVDESRLVDPTTRSARAATIQDAVTRNSRKVQYLFNLSSGPYRATTTDAVPGTWQAAGAQGIVARPVPGNTGAASFALVGKRQYYTVAERRFARAQSWTGRTYAVLTYWSSGVHADYRFIVDFDDRHTEFSSYTVADDTRGWHTAVLPIGHGWWHVVGLRVTTATKTTRGHIVLGKVGLLFSPFLTKVEPLATAPGGRARVLGAARRGVSTTSRYVGGRWTVRAVFPRRLASARVRLWIPPRVLTNPTPAVAVAFRRDGPSRFGYSFDAKRRGMLVLAQSYDGHWRASELAGQPHRPTPELSLVTGFRFGPGLHAGYVTFRGSSLVRLGVALSLVVLLTLLAVATILRVRERRGPAPEARETAAPPVPRLDTPTVERTAVIALVIVAAAAISPLLAVGVAVVAALRREATWAVGLLLGAMLVALAPMLIALNRDASADRIAVAAIAAVALGLVRLVLSSRRLAAA